ncbi:MAG: hypothetical protein JOZ57_03680, partial [Abitibacteriaceae bacterium]|nr:hypothetical protein [Abditibacteriaceae bacterium]
ITDITPGNTGGTELDGTLNSTPNSTFTLDFYRNAAPGASGYGQGQEYIGSTNVQTNGSGNATFSFTFNGTGQFFAATATNTATGDTSEFSAVPLNITSFSPTSGPVGTLVTINGAGFTDGTVVLFTDANDPNGFVPSTDGGIVSSSQLLARVPVGATTGPIGVTNADGSASTFSSTDFQVTTGPGQPPPNDNFAKAQVIQGDSGKVTGTNVLATKEAGEPTHADVGGSSSVWYKWTASTTGSASFDTTGSDFDTVLAVYQGTAVNALTEVASNDNAGIGDQSAVRFNAVAGQTYYIAVDGYDYGGITAQGRVVVNWSVTVGRPANDNFAKAQVIVGNSGHVTGTNVQATKEPGEPNHAGNPGGRSVWYAWTAPASGNATFTTAQSDFDTLLAVYTGKNTTGNTVRTLNLVASNDDEDIVLTSSVTFQTVAGRTYYIAVDGYDYQDGLHGDQGHVVLDWRLEVSNGATVRWINPAGGQWGNAANWSPARVPGPTDIATINLTGTYSITLNINTTAGGLALGAPSGTQTLVLNGHTLTLNGISSVTAHGVVNLSQGTLNENGSLTIAGVFNWTGGHLGGLGSTNIASAGVWNINDPSSSVATRKFLDQKTVNNFGTVNWRGKGSIIGGNGTRFRNNNLVYAMSDATFGWDGIGDNPTFINLPGGPNMPYGKFIKTVGEGTEDVVTTPATVFDRVVLFIAGADSINLSGFVQVQQGTIRLQGGGQSYGRFDVPAGSQLQFTSDYFFAKDIAVITGTGHICVLGNTTSINTNVNAETFSVCNGTLTGDSNITATHFFNWEGGTMSGHGQTTIGHGATFSIHGTVNHIIIGRTLNNAGIADWIGKSHILANGGVIINNTGTFNTQSGSDGATLDHNEGNDPTFNNSGILNPGGSQQVATDHSIGTRSVSASLAGVFSIYGNYNQSAGGILNMDIGGKVPGSSYDQVNIKGSAQLGGTLNVKFQSGYVPQPGDTFEVLHYDSRQGAFNVHFQNLPPNTQLQTIYTDTGTNKGLS